MEEGKCYKILISGENYIFKINNIEYGRAQISYYIVDNKFYVNDKYGIQLSNDYIYNEVDFKEMLDYLPDNHPDKITYLRRIKIQNLLNGNR